MLTSSDVHVQTDERSTMARPRALRLHPFHLVVLLVGLGGALIAAGPLSDLDLYWHIRAGAEIWKRHTVSGIGAGWVYGVDASHWRTSQWLSELTTYGLHQLGGYQLIRVASAALAALVVVGLIRLAVRPGAVIATSILAFVVVLPMAPHLEDRPATVSLLLLIAVARPLIGLARGQAGPGLLPLMGLSVLWVQLHGYWILLPMALLVGAVCRLADRELTALVALRPANYATACTIAACLNPLGPSALLTPFQFGQASRFISEWKSTSVDDIVAWGLVGVVAIALVTWARSAERIPLSELLWFLAWGGFGLLAYRNVAVALILLTPLVADRLAATYPDRHRDRSPGELRGLRIAAAGLLVCAVLAPVVRLALAPTLPRSIPDRLLAEIKAMQPAPRVLNEYNVAGQVLAFGGGATVAVDGRADLSSPFLPAYLDLIAAQGDFDPLLRRLAPTAALVNGRSGIVRVLRERGWREVDHQGRYVLLTAP